MLKEYLTTEIKNWEFIGAPALMQRFVRRNGRAFTPVERIGKLGVPKQCFDNAARVAQKNRGWQYAEGFAINRANPIMAFHHAWVTPGGSDAMDFTLPDASDYDYYGISFDRATVKRCAGSVLDTGFGLNVELMFKVDPSLEGIVKAVRPSAAWLRATEQASCE